MVSLALSNVFGVKNAQALINYLLLLYIFPLMVYYYEKG